jgi:hypothetical protein
VHGVEGQDALQALDDISKQKTRHAEGNQRRSVLRPALFGILAYANQAVDEAFHRAQQRMEKGPLALKYLGHMSAKGLGDSEDHDEVSDDLQNAKRCHVYSSFLKSVQDEARRKRGKQIEKVPSRLR